MAVLSGIYSNLKITVEESEVFVAVCAGFATVIISENYKSVTILARMEDGCIIRQWLLPYVILILTSD